MPMIKIQTSNRIPDKRVFAKAIACAACEATGKSECYMQIVTEDNIYMQFAGNDDSPSAMLELRAIGGLSSPVCKKFSELVCRILKERAGISPERIYINFIEFDSSKWGWNSGTF